MDKFWKAAIAATGLGGIGAFVFWSLYRQWLTLPIFSQLTSEHTFIIMLVFLGLSFLSSLAMLIAYAYVRIRNPQSLVPIGQRDTKSDGAPKLEIASFNDIQKYDPRINRLHRLVEEQTGAVPQSASGTLEFRSTSIVGLVILLILLVALIVALLRLL